MATLNLQKTQNNTLLDKFVSLKQEANKTFAERDEVIHLMITAVLAKQNYFMLGEPGVAKSAVVRYLLDTFNGATGFEILMSRFTTPEQVFGPLDLKKLKEEGKQQYNTDGMLPSAHVAFLDEVWKSSNAIVNSLLTILNERLFHNGARRENAPLLSAFAASNELPQGSELGAIYDRFLLKSLVNPISNAGTLVGVLDGGSYTSTVKITLDEIEQAHDQVAQVKVPADVLQKVAELVFKLRKEGITISDRAVVQSAADKNPMNGKPFLSLIKTQAWLEGRDTVTIGDLAILKHAFWKDPKDQRIVYKHVNQIANPFDQKALELDETVDQIVADFEKEKEAKGEITAASEAMQKLKKTGVEAARLIGQHSNDPRYKKLVDVHTRIKELVKGIVEKQLEVSSPADFQRQAPVPG